MKRSHEDFTNKVLNLPDISKLTPQKKETVRKFLESFFCPERYWDLRQTMYKMISRTRTCESECVNDNDDNKGQQVIDLPKVESTCLSANGI